MKQNQHVGTAKGTALLEGEMKKDQRSGQKSAKSGGRGPKPAPLTLYMLYAHAGGRCQFDGCNKSVFCDELTLREFNKSNVAHIVASDPNGPRGDAVRSHLLSNQISNLMLMCPEHHKEIDDFPDDYPEAKLLEMKRKHEEAIAAQCELIYKEPSEVLMVSSPIKGHIPVTINFNRCADAVMPQKRVASIRGQRIKIEIADDYHSSNYWESASRALDRRYALTVNAILEEDANAHFSVFPLAPMPLIMKLGYKIGDKTRADVFQFSRATDSWNWVTQDQTNRFSVEKLIIRDGVRIALVFSLTADIATARITEAYDADILYFIRADRFGVDCIQSPTDLAAFWSKYQAACDEIKNTYPEVQEIGVFPAMPVSAAFEVGRRYMSGVYPKLRIYDDDNGFFETITIGGKEND